MAIKRKKQRNNCLSDGDIDNLWFIISRGSV